LRNEEEEREDAERKRSPPALEWKDYLALTIAAAESTFLPILIIIATLVGITMLIVHLWKP